jgi:hypothetical protein
MLIVHAVNVTGYGPSSLAERPDGTSDYEVQVSINDRTIWKGSVNQHIRAFGAARLLQRIAERMEADHFAQRAPVSKKTLNAMRGTMPLMVGFIEMVQQADEALAACPDCGHAWSRHVKGSGGIHACRAKGVEASGNFEACGCRTVPPDAKPRNRRTTPRFGDLERAVDKAMQIGPYDTPSLRKERRKQKAQKKR